MSSLDRKLAALLEDRKGRGRYRQLREYDTSKSMLIDLVSRPPSKSSELMITRLVIERLSFTD